MFNSITHCVSIFIVSFGYILLGWYMDLKYPIKNQVKPHFLFPLFVDWLYGAYEA